jgi:hypothetical protein
VTVKIVCSQVIAEKRWVKDMKPSRKRVQESAEALESKSKKGKSKVIPLQAVEALRVARG